MLVTLLILDHVSSRKVTWNKNQLQGITCFLDWKYEFVRNVTYILDRAGS